MYEGGVQDRNGLLLRHYPLARRIACRMYADLPKSLDLDDVISAAVMGLFDAIDKFDESRGIPLESYAKYRIRGAIVDALRAADWTPRAVRRKHDRLDRTRRELRNRLGRAPSRDEMADAIGVTGDKLDKMVRDGHVRKVLSLDAPATEDGSMLVELVAGEGDDVVTTWEHHEMVEELKDELERLPDSERIALTLYYFHEMKLREVGGELGVSESRVCQLCKQGIARLRKRLHIRLAA